MISAGCAFSYMQSIFGEFSTRPIAFTFKRFTWVTRQKQNKTNLFFQRLSRKRAEMLPVGERKHHRRIPTSFVQEQ